MSFPENPLDAKPGVLPGAAEPDPVQPEVAVPGPLEPDPAEAGLALVTPAEPEVVERELCAGEGTCLVCGGSLEHTVVIACPRCETQHHQECWQYGEGCAVYGCKAGLMVASARAEQMLEALPEEEDDESALLVPLVQLSQIQEWQWRLTGGVGFALCFLLYNLLPWKGAAALKNLTFITMVACAAIFVVGRALPHVFQLWVKGVHRPGDVEETPAKQLEARLALAPKNVNLLEMLAYTRYAAGEAEKARELYERALAVQPDHAFLRLQLAKCLDREGRSDQALAELRKVAAGKPDTQAAQQASWWIGVIERREAGDVGPRDDPDHSAG